MDRDRLLRLLEAKGITASRGEARINIDQDLARECEIIDGIIQSTLKSGTISRLLRNQLVVNCAGISERDGEKFKLFEAEAILHTIGFLEEGKALRTRGPNQVKKGSLVGLWKAHFFQASFLPQNILNENSGNRGMSRIVNAIRNRHGSFPVDKKIDQEDIHLITKALVSDALDEKSSKGDLTGEHIFFAKSDKRNYYLFIEDHSATDAQRIQAAQAALQDFPEIQNKFPGLAANS